MKNILILSLIIVFEIVIINSASASIVSVIDISFQIEDNHSTNSNDEDDNSFSVTNNKIKSIYSIFDTQLFYVDSFHTPLISKAYNVRAPPLLFS